MSENGGVEETQNEGQSGKSVSSLIGNKETKDSEQLVSFKVSHILVTIFFIWLLYVYLKLKKFLTN